MITTQATFKLHTKCLKAEKLRENSTKIILVALGLKNNEGALQEYRDLHFSWFSSKNLSRFQMMID